MTRSPRNVKTNCTKCGRLIYVTEQYARKTDVLCRPCLAVSNRRKSLTALPCDKSAGATHKLKCVQPGTGWQGMIRDRVKWRSIAEAGWIFENKNTGGFERMTLSGWEPADIPQRGGGGVDTTLGHRGTSFKAQKCG